MVIEEKIENVLAVLDRLYPDARPALNFSNPYELLVAAILSARCTDQRVNRLTPSLFKKYPDAEALGRADIPRLESDIKPTGFYRTKAQSLKGCARDLVEKHGGKVPPRLADMVKLPGVGRKTANMVLGAAYGIPGVVVDTHVSRVSQRLGLTNKKDAARIEIDLMEIVPQKKWILFSDQLIQHGRNICAARKPKCSICPLFSWCNYARVASRS